jgi:hypothetical protein
LVYNSLRTYTRETVVNKYDLINVLTAVGLLSWATAALIPLFWELWSLARSHRADRDRQVQAAVHKL